MGKSIRNLILGRPRIGDPVDVPEWGLTVYVRGLSGDDARRLNEATIAEDLAGVETFAFCVLHGVTEDDGSEVFESIEEVMQMDFSVIHRLGNEVQDRTHSPDVTADDIDEAEKNSETTPS